MARCACGTGTCSCIVKAAPNGGATVVGNGSATRPYLIGVAGGNPLANIDVVDTPTLDLTISGAGTVTDKRKITGKATQSLTNLKDVRAGQPLYEGDVPVWRTDHWEFETPAGGGDAIPSGGGNGYVLTQAETLTNVNILPNPRFVGAPLNTLPGYTRWTWNRGTAVADATVKRHPEGPQSAKVTVTDTSGAVYLITGTAAAGAMIPISAGAVLTAIFSVYPGDLAGGLFTSSIYYYDAANVLITTVSSTAVSSPDNMWTDHRHTYPAAPAGATQVRVQLGTSSTTRPLNSNFWLAEPLLVASAYADPYFDGETADDGDHTFAWAGTADASPSNRSTLSIDWKPNPLVQELLAVDLNTVTTSGTYSQSQSVEATLANNYPYAIAGMLEVFKNPYDNMIWQRYTTYPSNNTYGMVVYTRGWYFNASVGTWTPWKQIAGFTAVSKAATSLTTISSAATQMDITGMTVTISVPGPDSAYMVTVTFDVACVVVSTGTFVGGLTVDGTTYQPTAILNPGGSGVSFRATVSQTVLVTGVTAGSRVFKGYGLCSAANQFKVNATHSTINVTQIA